MIIKIHSFFPPCVNLKYSLKNWTRMKFTYGLPQEVGHAIHVLYNAVFDQVLTIENMNILGIFVLVCICIFAVGTN